MTETAFVSFDDLEDDAQWEGAGEPVEQPTPTAMPFGGAAWKERCSKCRGSGRWISYTGRSGDCFACKGQGFKSFRTSPEERAAARIARDRGAQRKAATLAEQAAAWSEANPAAAAWITAKAPTFSFAAAMAEALARYGALTEKQAATVARLAAADAERALTRAADREAREAAAPTIANVEALETAFATAREAGIKRPKLRLAGFTFSPAPAHGMNAGAIYAKQGETYLGKVTGGRFICSRDCSPEQAAAVLVVAADPEQSAVAYGKRFGSCACCGRELSDPASVERGIGPICAERFGWG